MAERLTRIIEDGPISVLSVCQARVEDVAIWREWSVSKDSSIKEALLRLAAYEDTGLTPELCAECKKFEDEVVASGMTFGEVVELMHKKQDGRLVALPCNVGDIVYVITQVFNGNKIERAIGSRKIDRIGGNALNPVWVVSTQPYELHFLPSEFGKTVFLTRDEAEKALGKEQA